MKFPSLRIAACFVLIITALLSAHAHAADDSNTSWAGLWSQYIGGEVDLPMKVTDLKDWVLVPDGPGGKDPCADDVNSVLSKLSKYEPAVTGSSNKAKSKSLDIYDHLVGLRLANPTCYERSSEAYLLGSIYESNQYDGSGLSALATTGCSTQWCAGPPQSLYLLLLTKALLKAHAIRFVTPDACEIEFAYMCDPGFIQLNPISKPIDQGGIYGSSPEDFAGHYFHELSHLFRDKFVSAEYLKAHFPDSSSPSGIDWRSYLLLDETLAKTIAGTLEISQRESESNSDKKKPSIIGNDLSLFSDSGPLEHLVVCESSSTGGLLDIVASYSQLIGATFLRAPESNGNQYSPQCSDDATSIQAVYVALQNGYFPGLDPDGKTIHLSDSSSPLNPMNQSLDFDPLNTLLSEKEFGVYPYRSMSASHLALSDVLQLRAEFEMAIGPFPPFKLGISKATDTVVPMLMFLQQIKQVVDSLERATPVCQAFNTELMSASASPSTSTSALAEYFGGSCLRNGTAKTPVHPENGGRTDQIPTDTPSAGGSTASSALAQQMGNPAVTPQMNVQTSGPGLSPTLNQLLFQENGGRTDSPARP